MLAVDSVLTWSVEMKLGWVENKIIAQSGVDLQNTINDWCPLDGKFFEVNNG
jgi:hypothetical protein